VTNPGVTFNQDLTMTIYAAAAAELGHGATIVSSTQNFNIPFRPSASSSCAASHPGEWSDGANCFNGYATPVTFTFDGTVLLPDDLIWSISFNTSSFGAMPKGYNTVCVSTPQGCGYDSLNVGLSDAPLPTKGTGVDLSGVYSNSYTASQYGDGGTGGVDMFRSDTPCWTGYRQMARISTSAATVGPPTKKDQCKRDGWKSFNNPAFKNQGDCVSFVATKGKNPDVG